MKWRWGGIYFSEPMSTGAHRSHARYAIEPKYKIQTTEPLILLVAITCKIFMWDMRRDKCVHVQKLKTRKQLWEDIIEIFSKMSCSIIVIELILRLWSINWRCFIGLPITTFISQMSVCLMCSRSNFMSFIRDLLTNRYWTIAWIEILYFDHTRDDSPVHSDTKRECTWQKE